HLDHVGAQAAEQQRAVRARQRVREVQDADSLQRQRSAHRPTVPFSPHPTWGRGGRAPTGSLPPIGSISSIATSTEKAESYLDAFQETLSWSLDPFQREAIKKLDTHAGVLVSAPTSSGKTVVADYWNF